MTFAICWMCRSLADLTPLSATRQLVNDKHHVVLRADPSHGLGFDVRLAIDRLAPQLPECTVFECGGGVTIKKVIAEDDVLAQADAIVAAAVQFRRTVGDLMNRLSQRLGIPLESFYIPECRPLLRRGWIRDRWLGRLDSC
jgi:hypothetical protein